MENRNGLVSDACLTRASGTAERDAALALTERRTGKPGRITLGADKGYYVAGFITALRSRSVTPHIAADRRVSKTGRIHYLKSTAVRQAGLAMKPASLCANGSRKYSAG